MSVGDIITHTATVMYYGGVTPELVWYLDGGEQEATVIFLSHANLTQMMYVAVIISPRLLLKLVY